MPLTVNVGLSRKKSENFNSEGVSINLTAELDQALLASPPQLQEAIDGLYQQAHHALERQAPVQAGKLRRQQPDNHEAAPHHRGNGQRESPGDGHHGNGATRQNGNGHGRHHNNGQVRPMSGSQRKAIFAIASRLGIDAAEELYHELGVDLATMDIRQASRAIDYLNSLAPRNGDGH